MGRRGKRGKRETDLETRGVKKRPRAEKKGAVCGERRGSKKERLDLIGEGVSRKSKTIGSIGPRERGGRTALDPCRFLLAIHAHDAGGEG